MAPRDRFVMVLWASKFDELTAAVFVALLRDAGIRVKLVGLSSGWAAGSRGLGLFPDLTLDEALPLSGAASCIVIPCRSFDVRRLARDPRVRELLRLAQANHASVVVSQGSDAILSDMELVHLKNGSLMTFSSGSNLLEFVGALAGALLLTS